MSQYIASSSNFTTDSHLQTSNPIVDLPFEIRYLDLSALQTSYTQLAADYHRLKSLNNVQTQEIEDYRKRNMELHRNYSQDLETIRFKQQV